MPHGDMPVYSCTIPAGTLVAGTNTVTLGVYASRTGTQWLSPNYVSKHDPSLVLETLLTPS
jgi:hypothetical protein